MPAYRRIEFLMHMHLFRTTRISKDGTFTQQKGTNSVCGGGTQRSEYPVVLAELMSTRVDVQSRGKKYTQVEARKLLCDKGVESNPSASGVLPQLSYASDMEVSVSRYLDSCRSAHVSINDVHYVATVCAAVKLPKHPDALNVCNQLPVNFAEAAACAPTVEENDDETIQRLVDAVAHVLPQHLLPSNNDDSC